MKDKKWLGIVFAVLCAGGINGGPVTLTSSASAAAGVLVAGCTGYSGPDGLGPVQTGATSATASASASLNCGNQGNGLINGSATATVDMLQYGNLDVIARTTVTCFLDAPGCGSRTVAQSTATASFSDSITLFGGTGTATLVWFFAQDVSPGVASAGNPAGVATVTESLPTTVTFGVPFDISASIMAQAPMNYQKNNGTATATFYVVNLQVNGSIVGYQYTTASGQNDLALTNVRFLGQSTLATPEPAYTWFLAALIPLGIFVKRRARVNDTVC